MKHCYIPLVIALAFIVSKCDSNKTQTTNTDLSGFENSKAIPVSKLNGAFISFIDADGKKTPSVSIAGIGMPSDAFAILPDSSIEGVADANEFIKNYHPLSSPGDTIVYMVKCRQIKVWNNQTVTITENCVIIFSDRYLTARLVPQFAGFNLKPLKVIQTQTTSGNIVFLSCQITLTGTVYCSNNCSSPGNFHCNLVTSDGLNYPVTMPAGDESGILYLPCNSLNNCSGDSTLPPVRPGSPNDSGHTSIP